MQKGVDGETGRKEIDKVAASPSPSEGGDVRGYGGIWWLTKPRVTASPSPSRGRGCTWRDTECWGLGVEKDEKLGLKVICLFAIGGSWESKLLPYHI